MAFQKHKGRNDWYRWQGRPSLMARIGEQAIKLVAGNQPGPVEFRLKIESPTVEAEFITPEDFLEDVGSYDLGEIQSLGIEARESGQRIAVSLARASASSKEREPVVRLRVSGVDRHWVQDATGQMKAVINQGSPRRMPWLITAGVAFGLSALGGALVAFATDEAPGSSKVEVVSRVILFFGIGLFILFAFAAVLTPQLRLRPDGVETGSKRAWQWGRREVTWLTRTLIAAGIGSGLTLLIQSLVD
jgi:hypothetical protein